MVSRKSIPNMITGARLASLPVLWGFALAGNPAVVGAGVFFAWLTDALDGFLARALDAQSAWGSRFDSVTDTLVFGSALVWLVMLRPEFVRDHAAVLALWLVVGLSAYLVGWLRFRRIVDLHLYSAKAANFAGFLFGAALLAFGELPSALFYLVIVICILASTETLAAFATLEEVDENVGTILPLCRSRDAAGA